MRPRLAERPRTDRAFERLYRQHVHDVYRYALVVLRRPEDSEDITQTTFLNAYSAYARGERPPNTLNWLIGIATKLCQQRARQEGQLLEVGYDDADEAVPDEDTPTRNDVRRALGRISFDQRAALIMREVEGHSYREIAEILKISPAGAETLIFLARRALREQLEGAFTCHEAERAISRRLDGELDRSEWGPLQAHLQECTDCAGFASSQRAQRAALRALAKVPLPSRLATFFGTVNGSPSTA